MLWNQRFSLLLWSSSCDSPSPVWLHFTESILKTQFPTNINQSAPIYKPASPNRSLQEALSTAGNTYVPMHSLKNKHKIKIKPVFEALTNWHTPLLCTRHRADDSKARKETEYARDPSADQQQNKPRPPESRFTQSLAAATKSW